jgi:hypothetical protein
MQQSMHSRVVLILVSVLAVAQLTYLLWIKGILRKAKQTGLVRWVTRLAGPIMSALIAILLLFGIRNRTFTKVLALAIVAITAYSIFAHETDANHSKFADVLLTIPVILVLFSMILTLMLQKGFRTDTTNRDKEGARPVYAYVWDAWMPCANDVFSHSAVVVDNKAWEYANHSYEPYEIKGTSPMPPDPFGLAKPQRYLMGWTLLDDHQISQKLWELQNQGFHPADYNFLKQNCNHFTDAFIRALGIDARLPTSVNCPANTVAQCTPTTQTQHARPITMEPAQEIASSSSSFSTFLQNF